MVARLLQNFNGSRALIVTANRTAVEALETTLAKLGVTSEFLIVADGRVDFDMTSLKQGAGYPLRGRRSGWHSSPGDRG